MNLSKADRPVVTAAAGCLHASTAPAPTAPQMSAAAHLRFGQQLPKLPCPSAARRPPDRPGLRCLTSPRAAGTYAPRSRPLGRVAQR